MLSFYGVEAVFVRHEQPLVMGIALHAYIVGQPFRLRKLRRALEHIAAHRDDVWLTTSGEIAAHARTELDRFVHGGVYVSE